MMLRGETGSHCIFLCILSNSIFCLFNKRLGLKNMNLAKDLKFLFESGKQRITMLH